jgi:hypothetical protein
MSETRNQVHSWIGACLVLAVILQTIPAFSQEVRDEGTNAGEDFFRPPTNLFQVNTQYRTAPGTGPNGTITNVTTETIDFRYDHALDLAPMWILALRSDLPVLAKNPFSSDNPDRNYLYGVGDADVQAVLIHDLSQRLAVGFGARLITPTGSDTFGSGKWQVMPMVGARYALWEISPSSYLEPVLRYDVSFAGDPTRKNISNLQIAPTLNIGLPDQWYVSLFPSPDIRINFGDPITGQTGRLFVPFDFRVGRKLDGGAALSFELGVPLIKDYPVYNIKTQVRFNQTF